jgi:sugar phosphate isomerase/epimerase
MNEMGCSTFCLTDLPLMDALDEISGWTGTIEILSDGNHDLFGSHEACFSFDARYSVHAPCSEINLGSVYEKLRSSGIAVIRDLCTICDEIGAKTLVVHPGMSSWETTRGRSGQALLKSLDDLSLVQEEHTVRIGVENMGGWECCHFRHPDFIGQVTGRGLEFVLDIGHAHLNGMLETFLEEGSPGHVHIHDNDGTGDTHAACGTGTIDFGMVMERLPDEACRIIEVREPGAFDRSRTFLEDIPATGRHPRSRCRPCGTPPGRT